MKDDEVLRPGSVWPAPSPGQPRTSAAKKTAKKKTAKAPRKTAKKATRRRR